MRRLLVQFMFYTLFVHSSIYSFLDFGKPYNYGICGAMVARPSRSEGCVFDSRRVHVLIVCLCLGERFILFIDFGKLYNYEICGAMVVLLTLDEKGVCLIPESCSIVCVCVEL